MKQYTYTTKDDPIPRPFCPIFNKILNKDWKAISEEISKVMDGLELIYPTTKETTNQDNTHDIQIEHDPGRLG